jgi:hypothetical protein
MEQNKEVEFISNSPTTIRLTNNVKDILKKSNILFYEKSFNSFVNHAISCYILDFLNNLENKNDTLIAYCKYIENKFQREKLIDLRIEEKRKYFLRKRIVADISLYVKNEFPKKAFIDMLTLYSRESELYSDNAFVTENIKEILDIVKTGKTCNLKEVGDILYKEKVMEK